ncbi:hypothetical protein ACFYZ3_10625 [Streptomyces sp. NPDC001599]|uniref:hypothetical protein n=1 Tax=Streptomyces sp. NPDC001599 TaxID=3364591 RepID=UPI00369E86AA
MAEEEHNKPAVRSFLSCATEVARLMDLENAADVPEAHRARHLADAVRKPLLERTHLPEEFFARDPAMDESHDVMAEWRETVR